MDGGGQCVVIAGQWMSVHDAVEDSDDGDGAVVVRSVWRGGGWAKDGHGPRPWRQRIRRREHDIDYILW